MAEIHVIFPKKGGVVVNTECKAVLKDEFVNWHLYCQNPKVKKVRLRFDSGDAVFFPTGSFGAPVSEVTKDIVDGSTIWGRAPSHAKDARRDKYTIQGLDGKGKVVAVLDPEIITQDPKKP